MTAETFAAVSTWRANLYARVAEVVNADRALKAVPGDTETDEFRAAYHRLGEALRALPLWLRWLFT